MRGAKLLLCVPAAGLALTMVMGNTSCQGAGSGTSSTGTGPVIYYGGKPGTLSWRGLGVAQSGPHKGQHVWVELGTAALAGALAGKVAAAAAADATGKSLNVINAAASAAPAAATANNPCPPGSPPNKKVLNFPADMAGFRGNVVLKCGSWDRLRKGRLIRFRDTVKCIQNILAKGEYRAARPYKDMPPHQFDFAGNGFKVTLGVSQDGTIGTLLFWKGNALRCADA